MDLKQLAEHGKVAGVAIAPQEYTVVIDAFFDVPDQLIGDVKVNFFSWLRKSESRPKAYI